MFTGFRGLASTQKEGWFIFETNVYIFLYTSGGKGLSQWADVLAQSQKSMKRATTPRGRTSGGSERLPTVVRFRHSFRGQTAMHSPQPMHSGLRTDVFVET